MIKHECEYDTCKCYGEDNFNECECPEHEEEMADAMGGRETVEYFEWKLKWNVI